MSVALISDLHLGTSSGGDLLRRERPLAALTERLRDVDHLVLLGDTLELREAPLAEVLDAARPALAAIGAALAGKRVTIVPGNHDHQLGAWLVERIRTGVDGYRLDVETIADPPPVGALAAVAEALGDAEVKLAYPGLWVRDDVYATHGHYLDAHNTVPTLERLAVGVVERLIGGLPEGRLEPLDYEAALGPIYSLTYNLAQASPAARRVVGGGPSVKAWRRLVGSGRPGLHVRLVSGALVGGAVGALNRAGLGPFRSELSAVELRRAGLRGFATVVERLGIDAQHVVFGHTHRSGPHGDEQEGWLLPNGTQLLNSGSWVHEPTFLGADPLESPYFPGTWVFVPDSGPPRLERLLQEVPPR